MVEAKASLKVGSDDEKNPRGLEPTLVRMRSLFVLGPDSLVFDDAHV